MFAFLTRGNFMKMIVFVLLALFAGFVTFSYAGESGDSASVGCPKDKPRIHIVEKKDGSGGTYTCTK